MSTSQSDPPDASPQRPQPSPQPAAPREAGAPLEPGDKLATATLAALTQALAQPLDAGLYIVATPIGNLADMTLRALAVLAQADVVYCEDTRRSRTLLTHYGLRPTLRAYHEHNAVQERPRVIAALRDNARVALISDAGTPLISDPGFKLAEAAVEAGARVIAVPGASAMLSALACAGLPTDAFHFAGFLPVKKLARARRLDTLRTIEATLILYETAPRLIALLEALDEAMPHRRCAVARELTKRYEHVERGTPGELAAWARDTAPRGEMVVLVAPDDGAGEETAVDDARLAQALRALLPSKRLREASHEIAAAFAVPRKRVYAIGLAVQAQAQAQATQAYGVGGDDALDAPTPDEGEPG
ncbi:MAG: 16S rRNA (cytidine(1402)-2'-O)-methyltransferase [Pseudomonadota bacterium]